VMKKSLHCTCHELNSGRPALGLVSILTELPQLEYWLYAG